MQPSSNPSNRPHSLQLARLHPRSGIDWHHARWCRLRCERNWSRWWRGAGKICPILLIACGFVSIPLCSLRTNNKKKVRGVWLQFYQKINRFTKILVSGMFFVICEENNEKISEIYQSNKIQKRIQNRNRNY